MTKSKLFKIALIVLLCLALAAAAVVGILAIRRTRGGPVKVYEVSDFAMDHYWGDYQEYYGPVTLDNIQPVYLSSTQQLGEILVHEGDRVHVGDPLMSYDTTLSEVSLERKRLEVQKLQLQLENLQDRLVEINCYVPYVPPTETPTPVPTVTPAPVQPAKLPALLSGTGTLEDPCIFMWQSDGIFDQSFFTSLLADQQKVYAIFRVYEDDKIVNDVIQSWNICFLKGSDGGVSFFMFEELVDEPGDVPAEEPATSGYTWSEICRMREECEEQIRDTELNIRMAQVEYERMQLEVDNGMVLSRVDGIVKSVDLTEEAMAGQEPVIYVSGGEGGYQIQCQMSELDLATFRVGQIVTVSSWETGNTVEGVVESISDTPVSGIYYYGEGSTASYYPFVVSIPEDAGFSEYEYVSVTMETQETDTAEGFYLEKPFILTSGGKSYVWVMDEDGRLTRREIQTGAVIWGSYVKIRAGLSMDEYIAFPYGKAVHEGARTEIGSLDDLYGGMY